jgi:hypothetical protein
MLKEQSALIKKIVIAAVIIAVPEIAKNYTEDRLKTIIKSTGEAAVKNAIGQYTIFNLAISQTEITEKIKTGITTSLIQYGDSRKQT